MDMSSNLQFWLKHTVRVVAVQHSFVHLHADFHHRDSYENRAMMESQHNSLCEELNPPAILELIKDHMITIE